MAVSVVVNVSHIVWHNSADWLRVDQNSLWIRAQRLRAPYRQRMSSTLTSKSLHQTSKVLCVVYAVIAIGALVATWTQNTAYLHAGIARFFTDFLTGVEVTPASRSIACDILYFFLAAAVFMVIEARKHGIRFVWAYILAGMCIAISVAFPLFLIARELRTGMSEEPRVRAVDTILLVALAVAFAALTSWIDTRA
jgi:Terpene cyclase DEP1